jgi:hypothetical protein
LPVTHCLTSLIYPGTSPLKLKAYCQKLKVASSPYDRVLTTNFGSRSTI